ncbi:MAG TPA: FtsQ-type POTRA domain-containing protein [Parachlamydiaceae bacterium]|nr:FtsQ-type POTRA domain-containing protein [Parachlamydiaceae bacterium]
MNDPKTTSQVKKVLTIKQAFLSILLSICFVSGSSFIGLMYYQHVRDKQRLDSSYEIVALVQTSPDREGLKTGYLAELLELSVDRPRNLYGYDTQEAAEKLLSHPVIKEAKVRKIRPGTLHVDYALRKPIAYVGDYTNTAIDATGTVFPFKPFYTPKILPEIILGEGEEDASSLWGSVMGGRSVELAFTLLELASQYCDEFSSVSCIDVSNAFALSDGKRQVVLVLEDRILRVVEGQTILSIHPRILRLRQDNYRQQLGNYLVLRSYLRENDRALPLSGKDTIQRANGIIIDMRLSELAFISKES